MLSLFVDGAFTGYVVGVLSVGLIVAGGALWVDARVRQERLQDRRSGPEDPDDVDTMRR